MIDPYSRFFTGIVASSDTGSYVTQVNPYGANQNCVLQGIPLVGLFTSTIGFKQNIQYPIGALVLCYHVNFDICYILGMVPDHDQTDIGWFMRALVGGGDGNNDPQNVNFYNGDITKQVTHNQNRTTDTVEGEHVIANEFGVLLGMFQTMANLRGSELAQVQCFVLDDLVRIISHNYEHFHAMGQFAIYHDGKSLMAEFGATHQPQEALGQPIVNAGAANTTFQEEDEDEPVASDDSKDYYKFSADERQTAIERLKGFIGRLGDLVNIFITRPDPTAVRALSGEITGNYDRGMANIHVGLDGSVNVRTLGRMCLEKTNWIQVPHRVRTPEDPQGDNETDISFEQKDPFKFDNSVTYRDNPTLYFLQMRDCNAYLQDLYDYKNFLKYKKDFKLSGDPQSSEETDIGDISQLDPYTTTNLGDYQLRRSGLYLMDNGGWMLKDAWGSAIVSEGGNIYVQPAKDLVAQPMRNFIAKVGQFTSIASQKDVDISSTKGGFRLKTNNVQHFYSDKQGIILQSNSSNKSVPSPDDQAYDEFGGILLKADKTGVYQYAASIFDRATTNSLYKSNAVVLESDQQSMQLRGVGLLACTTGAIELFSEAGIDIFAQGGALFAGAGSTALGAKDQTIGVEPADDCEFYCPIQGVIPPDAFDSAIEQILDEDPQESMSPFDEDNAFTDVEFRFLDSDNYNLGDEEDALPMTIAQQDDQAFQFLNLSAWNETEINGTLPYPGKDKFDEGYITCSLINLQKVDGDVYSKASSSLVNTGESLTTASLNNYKVLGN